MRAKEGGERRREREKKKNAGNREGDSYVTFLTEEVERMKEKKEKRGNNLYKMKKERQTIETRRNIRKLWNNI